MKRKAYQNSNILFLSDTHCPFMHKDAIAFYSAVSTVVKPERIIHVGDLWDQYMFGAYAKDPKADSAYREVIRAQKQTAGLIELFPSMTHVSSNHDDRLFNRAMNNGIPKYMLKSYQEIVGAHDTDWKWVDDMTIRLANKQHLYIAHTRGGNALLVAKSIGMNVVVGHQHTKHGVQYFARPTGNVFAIDVGCMLDDNRYAFAYNKSSMIRPMLGCAALIDCKPRMFTMNLKKNGRWDGKV